MAPVLLNPSRFGGGGGGGGGDAAYTAAVLADSPVIWNRLDELGAGITAATASSFIGAGEEPDKAIDGVFSSQWTAATNVAWLRAQLASAAVLTTYTLYSRPGWQTRAAANWTFEGSNDGTTFTVLDTHTGVTWTSGEVKTFTFTNTTAYLYYRYNITAVNGGSLADLVELALPFAKDASGNNRIIAYTSGTMPTLAADGPVRPRSLSWGSASGFARSLYEQAQPSVGTFELWVKYAAAPAATVTLVSWSPTTIGSFSDGNGNSYVQLLSSGKIRLGLATASGPVVANLDSPSALSTGVWHHVIGSWGAAGSKLRIDAAAAASGAVTSSYIGPEVASFRIHGRFVAGGTNGEQTGAVQMAETTFYAAQLSDARTDAHYTAI